MNRVIEFRIWDKAENEFAKPSEYTSAIKWFEGEQDNLDSLVIQQFTGLLDKNGQKIFEGDIIKIQRKGEQTQPVFESVWYCEELTCFNTYSCLIFNKVIGSDYSFEVVGNIFQTPELLTAWLQK